VGTGESNIFRSSYTGVGVYKSTDNAKTFQHMGLIDTGTIGRIVVHPTDPNTVYVASAGQEWTENEMRGVFKTTDGGKTWTHSLKISPKTGAVDLAMDPKDPNTFYAAAWQRQRRKWNDPRVEPGFEESGVFKTTDGQSGMADAVCRLERRAPAWPRRRYEVGMRHDNHARHRAAERLKPRKAAADGSNPGSARAARSGNEVYRRNDGAS
jgi:hypothetical protein